MIKETFSSPHTPVHFHTIYNALLFINLSSMKWLFSGSDRRFLEKFRKSFVLLIFQFSSMKLKGYLDHAYKSGVNNIYQAI